MNKILFLLLLTGQACILAACGPSPEQQSAMTATALTAAAARWTPTPTPSPTATLTPTLSPTPSSIPTSTLTSTPNLTPTRTPDPDRYYPPGTSISLVPPESWVPVSDGQGSVFVGPRRENFFPRIFINEERDDSMEGMYTAQVQDAISAGITGYKLIGEDFLTSPDGLPYFRWEFQGIADDGMVIRFVIYIFESGELKEVLHYIRPMNSGKELDKPVEEAILSVRFEE